MATIMKPHKHDDFAANHCSRWPGIPQDKITPFGRKSVEILAGALRTGVYNLEVNWSRADWKFGGVGVRIVVSYGRGWSTYDFDGLTRLVILAHDELVRVDLTPASPKRMAVSFFQRNSRDGEMSRRHPTIEDAIIATRKGLDP